MFVENILILQQNFQAPNLLFTNKEAGLILPSPKQYWKTLQTNMVGKVSLSFNRSGTESSLVFEITAWKPNV